MPATGGVGVGVLLVDADATSAERTREFLEHDGRFAVETATTAAEGLDRLAGVDCVVSDYVLPDATGVEFVER
jgi:CheY-like chemotaxis protein